MRRVMIALFTHHVSLITVHRITGFFSIERNIEISMTTEVSSDRAWAVCEEEHSCRCRCLRGAKTRVV